MFCTFLIQAQDTIVLQNATKYVAKVLEINENNIRYKLWNNQDGPIYTISTSKISHILYVNGYRDNFMTVSSDDTKSIVSHTNSEILSPSADLDIIELKNNSKTKGKVLFLTNEKCIFRNQSNTTTLFLPIEQVKSIQYSNGELENPQTMSNNMVETYQLTNKFPYGIYTANGNSSILSQSVQASVFIDFENTNFEKDQTLKDYLEEKYITTINNCEQTFIHTFNENNKRCQLVEDASLSDYFFLIYFKNITETSRGNAFYWLAPHLFAKGFIEIWEKKSKTRIAVLKFYIEAENDYSKEERMSLLFSELAITIANYKKDKFIR